MFNIFSKGNEFLLYLQTFFGWVINIDNALKKITRRGSSDG